MDIFESLRKKIEKKSTVPYSYSDRYVKLWDLWDMLDEAQQEFTEKMSAKSKGWIPTSVQRYPKINGDYLVTVRNKEYKEIVKLGVVKFSHKWKISPEWEILAWRKVTLFKP